MKQLLKEQPKEEDLLNLLSKLKPNPEISLQKDAEIKQAIEKINKDNKLPYDEQEDKIKVFD